MMDVENAGAHSRVPAGADAAAGKLSSAAPPGRSARSLLRRLAAVAVLSAVLLLSACSLIPGLGPNQAYLTITNPNNPLNGSFTYTTIILDGAVLPYTITAGASQQFAVTYNQGHTLSYTFYAKPAGGSPTTSPVGPVTIFVPQGGYVYLGAIYQ